MMPDDRWLFAFDAAGIATFRTMALLATHPSPADPRLEYLRACVLESIRLWPTTLLIVRDSTQPTTWGDTVVPAVPAAPLQPSVHTGPTASSTAPPHAQPRRHPVVPATGM